MGTEWNETTAKHANFVKPKTEQHSLMISGAAHAEWLIVHRSMYMYMWLYVAAVYKLMGLGCQ